MTPHFEFQTPWVLGLLGLLPVYAVLRGRVGKLSALRFSSAELARSAGRPARSGAGRLLFFLRLLTAALLIVTLAGPRISREQTEVQASGVDIVLLVDVSWSMMSIDMGKPSERITRFSIAQSVLRDFIQRRVSDRLGLIVFSGEPYTASPLTLNHDWVVANLNRVHIGTVHDLGTAIGDATASAVKRLSTIKNSKSKIIILLTDGDNNAGEIDPLPAADLAAALGIKIYTIGIGQETPCRLPAFDPATGVLRLDARGDIIPTITLQPANYTVLTQMAHVTHGKNYRATNQSELAGIYDDINRLEKTDVKLRRFTQHTPLYQWPLGAALGALALELILAATWLRRIP